jgi:type II secretory pathway pseudopilin PulG
MTGRDRVVVIIVAAVVAVAAIWLFVIQPKRDQASKLDGQVAAAQQQLNSARAQIATAQADERTYAQNYQAVASLGEAVPSDDQTPSLIYELQNAATKAHVDFRSLVLNPATSATPPPPTSSSTSGSSSSKGSSSSTPASSTTSSSTTNASTSQSVTATLPPGSGVGPAGLPTLPFTFTFQGNFFHLADFFNRLERFVVATNKSVAVSGRLMSLNAISLGAGPHGFPQITATISATTYLVPANQGATNGAGPSGPASGSQSVSGGSTATGAAPAAAAISSPVR